MLFRSDEQQRWVVAFKEKGAVRIYNAKGEVLLTLADIEQPEDVVVKQGKLWVTDGKTHQVHRYRYD